MTRKILSLKGKRTSTVASVEEPAEDLFPNDPQITPIGLGQRGLVVALPGSGKKRP
ncbi:MULTISPECIES: hypothetical protein [Marinomonas]|uniref:Uncharacterized protein n=1 Tax=Marinomonas alcarazii TaxID=491949 RepID=A0A318V2E4_9GAMM|nr:MULTISPECIES: hypothetical protein [Marinomonas]PYF83036.1 hypothetical protein DFP75_102126 [Marinomonas alcarazii]